MSDATARSSRRKRRWILILAGLLVVFVAGGASVARWVRTGPPAAPAAAPGRPGADVGAAPPELPAEAPDAARR